MHGNSMLRGQGLSVDTLSRLWLVILSVDIVSAMAGDLECLHCLGYGW